jgi:hypothetical protein
MSYAERHTPEYHCAKYHYAKLSIFYCYAERRYAECHYAKCHGATLTRKKMFKIIKIWLETESQQTLSAIYNF